MRDFNKFLTFFVLYLEKSQKCSIIIIEVSEIRKVGYYKLTHNLYEYCPKCRPKRQVKNDLVGKKFGRLTVIERLENRVQPNGETKVMYRCLCKCGCLCSSMEEEFEKMLVEKNICYKKQYKFKECKDIRPLPFDFAIFDCEKIVMVVELNGEQHYYPFTFCGEDSEQKIKNFNDRVRKDNIKEEFCKTNNVPLLVISYRKFKKKNEIF